MTVGHKPLGYIRVHGTWYILHGTCYMVHGTWYMVHVTWYMVHVNLDFIGDDCFLKQVPTLVVVELHKVVIPGAPVH